VEDDPVNDDLQRILVLDFGGQTTHLIGRRLRERGVYAEIVSGTQPVADWYSDTVKGVILSGSPYSVHDVDAPRPDRALFDLGIPILGICYGLQTLVHTLGGTVSRSRDREYGPARIAVERPEGEFSRIESTFQSWMSHGDAIESLPDGAIQVAASVHNVPAVVAFPDHNALGLQFHPEVSHTEHGTDILERFARDRCGIRDLWSVRRYLEDLQAEVRRRVGDRNVLLLISGGVDSTVVAALLLASLSPEQVYLMYIDTGLMRKNESAEIGETLRALGAQHLSMVNAADRFLEALAGVEDPEEKRRIIGDMFIQVQQEEIATLLSGDYLLAQGTLYTDLIESGSGVGRHASRIKSHHNVASPLVHAKRERGEIVEPLAWLYKDEVRELGRILGVSPRVVGRHPFPGPGLAVRILGEVTRERCDLLREADALYIEALREAGLYDEIWQAFSVLLPIRSVGVTGDERAYGDVLALRAVVSRDGMTADMYDFDPTFLRDLAARMINRIAGLGRVVYDISGKPPATIEWE